MNLFRQLRTRLRKYDRTGNLDVQWLINQIVTLYNVFHAGPCTQMIRLRLGEHLPAVKPVLVFMGQWPEDEIDIEMDPMVVEALRNMNEKTRRNAGAMS